MDIDFCIDLLLFVVFIIVDSIKVCITLPSYQDDELILIILAGVSSFSAVVVLGIVVSVTAQNAVFWGCIECHPGP